MLLRFSNIHFEKKNIYLDVSWSICYIWKHIILPLVFKQGTINNIFAYM